LNLNTKLTVLFFTLFFSTVTSCSSVPVNSAIENSVDVQQKPYIVDMGYKGGVTVGTRINFAENSGFSTKANLNKSGHIFVKSDVDIVRVFLTTTTGSGDLSATLAPIAAMPAPGYIQLNKSGTSDPIMVIFTNVPGPATYRAAACALTTTALGLKPNGSANFPAPRDITKATNDFGVITLNGFTNTYILSNTGGDNGIGANNNKGVITIGPDLSFTHPNPFPFEVNVTLIDAEGATIDSTVSVTDGSAVMPAITIQ
jgi:hypothetical protein